MLKQMLKVGFFGLFLFLHITSFSHADDTVKLTNGEWPPYLSENLKYYGLASRIVTEAFALEGVTVEYSFFPWKRAFEMAKRGKWDGSVVWSINEQREKSFIFSDPVISDQSVFFHLKSVPFDWNSLEDLKGMKIGATLGYNYGDEFTEAEKNRRINVERVVTDEMNFKKILGNRMKVFVCDIAVGYSLLNKMYDKETVALFTHHPKTVKDSLKYLMLAKLIPENDARMVKFNAGLKKLKESGKYDQFVQESREGESQK